MSAIDELNEFLKDGEKVEAIVFGAWGWGSDAKEWELGYGEPNPPPVPFDKRGKLLSLKEAEPYMKSWNFYGGHGAPDCYATYIWSNLRVIWVTEYDGSTGLDSMPRNPSPVIPYMPGG